MIRKQDLKMKKHNTKKDKYIFYERFLPINNNVTIFTK